MPNYKSKLTSLVNGRVDLEVARGVIPVELDYFFREQLLEAGLFKTAEEREEYIRDFSAKAEKGELYGIGDSSLPLPSVLIRSHRSLCVGVVTARTMEELDTALANYETFMSNHLSLPEGGMIFRIKQRLEREARTRREARMRELMRLQNTAGGEGTKEGASGFSSAASAEGRVLPFDPSKGKRK